MFLGFITSEKGKLIQNRNHLRDRSKQIEGLKVQVLSQFPMPDKATPYVEEILERYPRYRRDQLLILQKIAEEQPTYLEAALTKAMTEQLYSANDFRDIVKHLVKEELNTSVEIHTSPSVTIPKIAITTRPMDTYTTILGGTRSE